MDLSTPPPTFRRWSPFLNLLIGASFLGLALTPGPLSVWFHAFWLVLGLVVLAFGTVRIVAGNRELLSTASVDLGKVRRLTRILLGVSLATAAGVTLVLLSSPGPIEVSAAFGVAAILALGQSLLLWRTAAPARAREYLAAWAW